MSNSMTCTMTPADQDRSVRLNRFLARCGFGSRRSVEALITAGRIAIAGEVVYDLGRRVEDFPRDQRSGQDDFPGQVGREVAGRDDLVRAVGGDGDFAGDLAPHAQDALHEGPDGFDDDALVGVDFHDGPVDVGLDVHGLGRPADEDLPRHVRDRLDRSVHGRMGAGPEPADEGGGLGDHLVASDGVAGLLEHVAIDVGGADGQLVDDVDGGHVAGQLGVGDDVLGPHGVAGLCQHGPGDGQAALLADRRLPRHPKARCICVCHRRFLLQRQPRGCSSSDIHTERQKHRGIFNTPTTVYPMS